MKQSKRARRKARHENSGGGDDEITADDQLIWDTPRGSSLKATQDVEMEDTQERVFTRGRIYKVEDMHPLAIPAFVTLRNDQGKSHLMEGSHVRQWFTRVQKPSGDQL